MTKALRHWNDAITPNQELAMGVGCTGVGVALGVGVGRAIASDKLAGTIGGAVVGIALIAPLLALAVSAGIRKQMRLT